MIDLRIHGKIPLLNDYGFEKGVLLFSLICFGESYRSCPSNHMPGISTTTICLCQHLFLANYHVDSSLSLSG